MIHPVAIPPFPRSSSRAAAGFSLSLSRVCSLGRLKELLWSRSFPARLFPWQGPKFEGPSRLFWVTSLFDPPSPKEYKDACLSPLVFENRRYRVFAGPQKAGGLAGSSFNQTQTVRGASQQTQRRENRDTQSSQLALRGSDERFLHHRHAPAVFNFA